MDLVVVAIIVDYRGGTAARTGAMDPINNRAPALGIGDTSTAGGSKSQLGLAEIENSSSQ